MIMKKVIAIIIITLDSVSSCGIWSLKNEKNAKSLLFMFLLRTIGSRGCRVVTHLAFQAEYPGSIPGAGSHLSFNFPFYIYIAFVIGSRILYVRALLRARTRTRVAVVEFHVYLYPISISPFLSIYAQ